MSRELKKFEKKTVEKDEFIVSLKLIFMGHFIDLILHYKKSLTKLPFIKMNLTLPAVHLFNR